MIKVGDTVRYKSSYHKGGYNYCVVTKITGSSSGPMLWGYWDDPDGTGKNKYQGFMHERDVELVKGGNMKFKENDIIVDEDGDYAKILAIVNNHYVRTDWHNSAAEANDDDVPYSVVDEDYAEGAEWSLTKSEYTLEEVAKALGVPVEDLRIKE